jgi:hypothetical protein
MHARYLPYQWVIPWALFEFFFLLKYNIYTHINITPYNFELLEFELKASGLLGRNTWATLPASLWVFFWIGVWTQGFMLAKQVLYHLCHTSSPFCSGYLFMFCFGSTEAWAQGLTLARQAFLSLEPLRQPFFVLGIFEIGSHKLFAWGFLLISVSWVAGITGMSHKEIQLLSFSLNQSSHLTDSSINWWIKQVFLTQVDFIFL